MVTSVQALEVLKFDGGVMAPEANAALGGSPHRSSPEATVCVSRDDKEEPKLCVPIAAAPLINSDEADGGEMLLSKLLPVSCYSPVLLSAALICVTWGLIGS